MHLKPLHAVVAVAALATLAGCATNPLEAQWSDPQLVVNKPLGGGARVLVVCESQDEVLRRICQDRVGAELTAAGAMPVSAPDVGTTTSAPGGPAPYVAAARTANAKAVFVTSIAPGASVARPGLSIGVGLGGFGGGGFGGGVGVSAPIGGGRIETSLAANTSVTDVATGRLMWTARASTAPSNDVSAQAAELAKKVVTGAGQAGLL
ncbi:MAG: hypothetical protein ABW190_16605 [Rhizobacter sp.]